MMLAVYAVTLRDAQRALLDATLMLLAVLLIFVLPIGITELVIRRRERSRSTR